MNTTPASTLADSEQLIADLKRQLAECRAERDEALQRETAAAEVLQVINSSPGNLASVFEAMLVKALRLCDASFGVLSKIDGNNFSGIAVHGAPPELAEALRQPRQIIPSNAHYRLVHGEDVVQIEDITAEEVYRAGNPARRSATPIRILLGLPY
jgi:hypothetical protein